MIEITSVSWDRELSRRNEAYFVESITDEYDPEERDYAIAEDMALEEALNPSNLEKYL